MEIHRKSAVAEVAASVKGAGAVFESFGIDYSCAGGRTIEEAARSEGADPDRVVGMLRDIPPSAAVWPERSLTDLARHLVLQHHRLLREELTSVAIGLVAVCDPTAHPPSGLTRLRALFTRLTERILPHLHHEEQRMFRDIERLETLSKSRGGRRERGLEQQIAEVVLTHGQISHELRMIRELRVELEGRSDLPDRVSTLLQRLAWLEAHLHEYMFLENCILLPRAIALEEELVMA
jgi:regulator of cell morphogenesis and NO signaling